MMVLQHARPGLGLAALALLAACDFPTKAPNWDMTWNVPAKSTSISVNTFLPNGVTVTPSGTGFQTSVNAVTITRTLAGDCPACVAANGQTVPKPAFTSSGSGSATLPSAITTATLSGDTLFATIQNGYNFDPIRPGAGNNGFIVIQVTSGSTTIGKDSLNGATSSLAAGSTTTRKIPLSGNVSGASGVTVNVTVNSPAGDPVTINTAQSLTITGRGGSATQGTVVFSSATVSLNNQTVTSTPTDLNLDISQDIRDRVQSGSLFLTIVNPFAITGNLTLTIAGGPSPVTKTVALAAGTSNVRVDFSQAEIRSVLAAKTLNFSGSIAGATAVTPGQQVSVSSRLQLTVTTKTTP